jgi:hypothetical protein
MSSNDNNKYTCEDCEYYWQNSDTEIECQGEDKICHEFIFNKHKQMK